MRALRIRVNPSELEWRHCREDAEVTPKLLHGLIDSANLRFFRKLEVIDTDYLDDTGLRVKLPRGVRKVLMPRDEEMRRKEIPRPKHFIRFPKSLYERHSAPTNEY